MIRNTATNFVTDFACWKYGNVFLRHTVHDGKTLLICVVCRATVEFKCCKDVDNHMRLPGHRQLIFRI